jgi:diguanylate cyclase (GGDEF)-like protein
METVMKKMPGFSITQRLVLTLFLFFAVISVAFGIVIRELYLVESTLRNKATDHIKLLTGNSEISRQVYEFTSRVKLLEPAFLYSESALSEEGAYIDEQLQRMRLLSSNRVFAEKMNTFIENFHRFLGNSLALNRILKQTRDIDRQLSIQLDELDLVISEHFVQASQPGAAADLQGGKNVSVSDNIHTMTALREIFLRIGKMLGSIGSRITPETEQVLFIAVYKELDIFLLHLDSLSDEDTEVSLKQFAIHKLVQRYKESLSLIQSNLKQRRMLIDDLVTSQDALLGTVAVTESSVKRDAVNMIQALEAHISDSRYEALLLSFIAVLFSVILIIRLVKKHIRSPLKHLSQGIKRLESTEFSELIRLGRTDEWSRIEQAFNNMALRLEKNYAELNEEKKNFDFLAHHDPLTGLANRLLATKYLQQLVQDALAQERSFFLLYLDIDEFKTVNDSLGHAAGDHLLKEVSAKLSRLLQGQGFVARMGGDEFMVILSHTEIQHQAELFAKEINQTLRLPYVLQDQTVFVSASIGICQFPHHGRDDETLIRNADTAMYNAKQSGRDQFCVYTDSMTWEVRDLIDMTSGLRQAIANQELCIHFQPMFHYQTGQMQGAEALIRWNHPKYGLLLPGEFLPVAEKSGLIVDIDHWVLQQVTAQIEQWQQDGFDIDEMLFSVNISARNFYSSDLVSRLESVLASSHCRSEQLLLEITERDMMYSFETSAETIRQLSAKGYRIAIDDFGTGHSSLAVLKYLPANYIKLDRRFIHEIAGSERDYAIIRAIVTLADTLHLSVIAEGVEEQKQAEKLVEIGCYQIQGHVFTKPMAVQDFSTWLMKPSFEFSGQID